jgi:acetyltransferase-like isoleucine patch superfamily enzyme
MSQIGFRIGAGTEFETAPQITGNRNRILENLVIGNDCVIGANCVFDLQDKITIGDRVTLGPGTMLLTSTHELGPQSHRAGVVTLARVVIQDGAWVRARAIILPGVTIGKGAIVEVGAVVNKDVAEHTRVGGVPAIQLESLVKQ